MLHHFIFKGSYFVSHEPMTIDELNADLEFLYRSGQWHCRISRQVGDREGWERVGEAGEE